MGHVFLFIERLVETFIGGPRCRGSGAQVLTRIPFPSVLAHGSSLCAAHVVFEVRPRSGHLQAAGCMRWQLDAGYTTIGTRLRRSFVQSCYPCYLVILFSPRILAISSSCYLCLFFWSPVLFSRFCLLCSQWSY